MTFRGVSKKAKESESKPTPVGSWPKAKTGVVLPIVDPNIQAFIDTRRLMIAQSMISNPNIDPISLGEETIAAFAKRLEQELRKP